MNDWFQEEILAQQRADALNNHLREQDLIRSLREDEPSNARPALRRRLAALCVGLSLKLDPEAVLVAARD